MAYKVKDIMNEVAELNNKINLIIQHSDFQNYEDLSGLDIDKTSAEELFLSDELYNILNKLSDVSNAIEYLKKPVHAEGILHKNENGRYEFNDIELSCGYGFEYLASDDRHMRYNEHDDYVTTPYWSYGRIEHDGSDYYIVGADKDTVLEGLRVRIRK